ncbi:EDD domain protein, DegV family [Acetitomaculum ruminis DSM 5522]|uniref:EDD domain protein, DegV family n=1 Tax=Acetitomaculum ruminis DSM 5522 TaxID=1120918 RepID=A0A1I1AFK3_9FIRM|nr:DegV family protein [Acetitomaculum ruminis]SFB36136.1 EDD domain protein, DegV family [Acetitomaculum ruminis DSM 5522]
MANIAIVTDSNSGITQAMAKEMGIHVLPMPFTIDGELFYEDISLTQEQFYEKLLSDAEVSTSQPSPGDVLDLWDKLLLEYDEIVHIPMSSGLSSSCSTATALSADYDGRVQVVNNQRISVTMRQSVEDAVNMAKAGKTAKEIKEIMEEEKFESSIYIMLDTLKYLKKGGRITPAAAAIGTVLKLKPVLQIQGEKLDAFSKSRNIKQAKKVMISAMKDDFEKRFSKAYADNDMTLAIAHTQNFEAASELAKELSETFDLEVKYVDPLSLSVSCHIGPGALAVACAKRWHE